MKINLKDEISIEVVKTVADITGPYSASQKALDKSKGYKKPRFFYSGSSIIVVEDESIKEGD